MIQIVEKRKIKKNVSYGENENIPLVEGFCFEPEIMYDRSKNKESIHSYLSSVDQYAKYVGQLVDIYGETRKQNDEADRLDDDILGSYTAALNIPRITVYGQEGRRGQMARDAEEHGLTIRFADNEDNGDTIIDMSKDGREHGDEMTVYIKNARAHIMSMAGSRLLEKCEEASKSPVADMELKELTKEKLTELAKIGDTAENDGNYREYNAAKQDIYFYFITDLMSTVKNILPKYFTSNRYFTSTGTSYFAVDTDTYLYIAGESRGRIAERVRHEHIGTSFNGDILNRLVSDMAELRGQIRNVLQRHESLFQSEKLTDNSQLVEEICKTMKIDTEYRSGKKRRHKAVDSDFHNPAIDELHKTHEQLQANFICRLLDYGYIAENEDKTFNIIKGYKTLIISYLIWKYRYKQCRYDLYQELFPNIKDTKNIYKYNRSGEERYRKNELEEFEIRIIRPYGH